MAHGVLKESGGGLGEYYEDVDVFTFSDATQNPDRVRKAVQNAPVYTHSAGMMALAGTWPWEIHAFCAPLPNSRTRLAAKTLIKTVRMHTPGLGIRSLGDGLAVAEYGVSSLAELAVHPVANLGPFLRREISEFDAVRAGIEARRVNIPTVLTAMDSDAYFRYSDETERQAVEAGLRVVRMPGEHDELVLRPVPTLESYTAEVS